MSVINTNIKSLVAQNSLSINARSMSSAMERLSTGNRINSAKDDAAGLAISTRMSADLRGMSVAIRNANDGISMMQTAEGAMGEVSNMLQRMRDLSVQASSATMTNGNRSALQAEFTQLVAEIDNVSKTTNFNGIKLLDGTAKSVSLQTGVNEGAQVNVSISATSSKQLGLQGFAVQGQLTSGRVVTIETSAGDVLINGKNATTATVAANVTAKVLAAAINLNSGEHRTIASAFNTLKGVAPTQSTFAAGDLQIGGVSVGAAGSVEELVSNINRDVGGVLAVLADDGTIELSNDTGESIVITNAGTPSKAGFTANTFTGFVTLNSMDNTDISVKAKSVANGFAAGPGATADVKSFGFNESVNGKSFTGTAVSAAAINADDDFRINGVRVGNSTDSSAAAKVAAINAISAQTGVTASASTVAKLTYSMASIADGADLTINGRLANIGGQTTIAGVVSTINALNTGAVASLDDDGNLLLSNDTGADITISEAASPFVSAVASQAGDAATGGGTTADPFILKGRISLTSETGADIRIESKTLDGSVSAVAAGLIGFADQGGTSTLVGGAMSISTQDGAGRAITAIDKALDTVSENRATLGAFQNRLTAAVDNLSDQSRHLSESKSRIMDTDYAVETTNLARAQVIQQAATAMLAQANQQPSGVLALLQ